MAVIPPKPKSFLAKLKVYLIIFCVLSLFFGIFGAPLLHSIFKDGIASSIVSGAQNSNHVIFQIVGCIALFYLVYYGIRKMFGGGSNRH